MESSKNFQFIKKKKKSTDTIIVPNYVIMFWEFCKARYDDIYVHIWSIILH